jgi:hypothetical protein
MLLSLPRRTANLAELLVYMTGSVVTILTKILEGVKTGQNFL